MATNYRVAGWGALVAGLSFLALPLVVTVVVPLVIGTSELTVGSPITDPAVIGSVRWLGAIEMGVFGLIAAGTALLVTSIYDLAARSPSAWSRAHLLSGAAAAGGWLFVAAASSAHYSSVIDTASPFGEEGRAVFFLAQAMDITTGVVVASIASGIWWLGCGLAPAVSRILGRPLSVLSAVVGAFVLVPNLFGIPWAAMLQIPVLILTGIVLLRRAPVTALAAAPSTAAQ
jgi:hypothetical protein